MHFHSINGHSAPKLEVPTIYKADFPGPKFLWGYAPNFAQNMVLKYLHFRILEFPGFNGEINGLQQLRTTWFFDVPVRHCEFGEFDGVW